MIASLSDSIALVKSIRDLGIESQLSGGAFGFAQPDFVAGAGETADKLVTASLWSNQLPYPGAQSPEPSAYRWSIPACISFCRHHAERRSTQPFSLVWHKLHEPRLCKVMYLFHKSICYRPLFQPL